MRRTRLALVSMTAAAALVLTACGGETEETPPDTTPEPTDEVTDDPTTPEPDDDETDGEDPDPAELPGTETEIGPEAGDALIPVGVPFDDVLHIRQAPDPASDSVGELQPVDTGVTATGNNRELDDASIWAEITVGDITGWSNWSYLGYIGDASDVTGDLPGDLSGETVWQLAEQVVDHLYPEEEGQPELQITLISDAVDDPDASDALIDVLGFADDSVMGSRVRVNAVESGDGYVVEEVVVSPLCSRGVSEGLCL